MRRIVIQGCSGSGKSTFARKLSAATGLPIISLDALYWQPGWLGSPRDDFRARLASAMAAPGWIMDGDYHSHIGDMRDGAADTIVFFDLPRIACMTGVLTRFARLHGRVRPEMAPGCPERLDLAFLRYVWRYRQRHRPRILAWIEQQRTAASIHVFTTRQHADAFLSTARRTSAPAAA